jgi:hypothetical protein
MSLRTLLIINSLFAVGFGLMLMACPKDLISMYGAVASDSFQYQSQLFGTCLVGYGFMTWKARDAHESELKQALILSLVIADGSASVIALTAQIRGVANDLGWLMVAIYLFLSLSFAYFRFVKSPNLK